MADPLKRGRGRPRKPVDPNAEVMPARPPHRPPVPFLSDPSRFTVTLALALETRGIDATRAREIAAIVFDQKQKSSIAIVPKAKWDASERRIGGQRKGAFLRMVLRPDLDRDEAATAPDLDSAERKIRRKLDKIAGDAETEAWIVLCAEALLCLRAKDPMIRAGARMQLIYRGWPAAAVAMIEDVFV